MQPGQRIGQYVLLEKLGDGGMGEVWKAEHTRMLRLVAIKFLRETAAQRPEVAERFLNEAQLQSRLHHPNIVAVFDAFEENGLHCMVMEFVDGHDLETHLAHLAPQRLSIEQVLSISNDVLAALEYAHSYAGGPVVHRDVKPSNILIDKAGKARLTDFGIAFALGGNRLTQKGTALGTVFYMSPEQITDPRKVDARSDIYSFGCVLYEMLAGRPPFGAESDTEFTIKSLHVKEMPAPLRRWNPNVPEEFEWIVLRALNKDPERRFAGCAEMAASLGAGLPEIADVSRRRPVQSELSSGSARQASASAVASPPAMAPLLSSVVPVAQPARPAVIPIAVKQPPARPTRSRLGLWIALAVVFLLAGATLALLRDRIFAAPEQIVLSLKGSTSVGDELAPRMAEAFLRDEMKATQVGSYIAKKDAAGHSFVHVWGRVPGDSDRQVIEIYATGSGDAFKCLAAGSGADHCDIGMASRPYNDQDRQKYPSLGNLGSGATEHVVALDGIAVIVNPANSVERLSIQQLRAIYTGRIRSWNQVGGPDAPIELYGRNQKSGTGEMFAQMVVGKDAQGHALPTLVAPDHQIEDSSAIVDAVMQSPNAIGYVSSPLIRSAKALAISDGSNAALSPSELAIVTEDYPIGRRLYLYAPGDASDLAQAFIRYAVNSRGQAVVTEAHYVALTPKSFAIHDVPPDAPAEYAEIAQHYQRLGLSFRFASGQAGISSGGHDSLDNLARDNVARLESYLAQHNSSGDDILLIGYADNVGGAGPNKALALSRAESVAESLATDDVRVPNSAIRSFGMELPVASNDTPEGRARNRRVEVWVRKGVE